MNSNENETGFCTTSEPDRPNDSAATPAGLDRRLRDVGRGMRASPTAVTTGDLRRRGSAPRLPGGARARDARPAGLDERPHHRRAEPVIALVAGLSGDRHGGRDP